MVETITADLTQARQAVEDAHLFSSLCTIRRAPGTLDAAGQPDLDPTHYVDIVGMVNIPCMASPEVLTRPDITDETKLIPETLARRTLHALLDGHYPQIDQKNIARIDGIDYDILAVENDSQGITTRLGLQKRVL